MEPKLVTNPTFMLTVMCAECLILPLNAVCHFADCQICCENFIEVFMPIFKKLKDSTLRALPAHLILSNGLTTLLGPFDLSVSP
jgi:hypothetical protein